MGKNRTEYMDDIKAQIAEAIAPDEMTKEEAVEFLEELSSDLDMQVEALQQEIENKR